MEERILNVNFNKSGSGSISKRLTLPSKIIADMGITENERSVILTYDDSKKEIIIKKLKKF